MAARGAPAPRVVHPHVRAAARVVRQASPQAALAHPQGLPARLARASPVLPGLPQERPQVRVDAVAGRRRPVARIHPVHAQLPGVLRARLRRLPASHARGRAGARPAEQCRAAPRVVALLHRGQHQPAQAEPPALAVRDRQQALARRRLRLRARLRQRSPRRDVDRERGALRRRFPQLVGRRIDGWIRLGSGGSDAGGSRGDAGGGDSGGCGGGGCSS